MLSVKYSPIKEGWFDCGMRGDTAATIPGLTAGLYPVNPELKGFKPKYFQKKTLTATASKPANAPPSVQRKILNTINEGQVEDTWIDFLCEMENDEFDAKKTVRTA